MHAACAAMRSDRQEASAGLRFRDGRERMLGLSDYIEPADARNARRPGYPSSKNVVSA